MHHRKKGKLLGRNPEHRKAMLNNLMCSLIMHEKIETTTGRAKYLRPKMERLITLARKGTLTAKRKVAESIKQKKAHKKFFNEIVPRFVDRPGGYLRILKKSNRKGDAAEVSIIEFVE